MPWTDNSGALNIAFGTHSKFQVWQGGGLYDVTPTLAAPAITLPANPLAVTNTSAVVTVTHSGHGRTTGDSVIVSGATAVGGITPNGTFSITVTGTNSYTYTFGSAATSTVTGGGGSAVLITPQTAFTAGQIDGTGGAGYGTGSYGVGNYSQPATSDYFPRTVSLGPWGQNLLASPRGQTIFSWNNDTSVVAAPLANAPANVSYMVVAPNNGGYQVFALGCNQETSGVFNPMCIRHSSVRNNTEWTTSTTTTAREYVLTGGGRIVAGQMVGPYLLVWTNDSLFLGEFVGNLDQPWSFNRVSKNCGLIGPNAKVVVGQTAYWVSEDRQFYTYRLGGQPMPIPCQIREDFADHLAASQGDKIVGSSNAEFSEVRFDYPDSRDGFENSRYVSLCVSGPDVGSWYRGQMARTAFVDAGPSDYPIGCTFAGNAYYHEKGYTADGSSFSWFIQTADQYLDENMVMACNGLWPDILLQQGPVYVTVSTRFFPQDTEVTTGPFAMALGAQKVDFRASGRLFRFRFSGNSSPTSARFGKFDVDASPGGLR